MQVLQLEPALQQTIELLSERQIEAVLLKGAGLVYTAYISLADRPMSDLDILVAEDNAQTAWALLQTHGWTASERTAESPRFSGHQHLPRLVRHDLAFPLEIHGALLSRENPFLFSMDGFWARAQTLTLKGRFVKVPHAMHQLWHACVHFAWSHQMEWGSWRTFRDVAAIIDRGGIDWAEFNTLARESRAATCCYWTLRLARRLMGAAVPDATLNVLRPPYPEFIVNRLERYLLVALVPSANRCPSVRLSRLLWEIAIAPRWSGHGASRPWQMSDRWVAGSGTVASRQRDRVAIKERIRQVIAGCAYLLRVNRLSLPVDSV
jgi:hypothetical protein